MAKKTSKSKKHVAPGGAVELLPVPKGPVGKIQSDERSKRPHTAKTRQDIRQTEHRVVGARQSNKPVERSGQQRQSRKSSGTKK